MVVKMRIYFQPGRHDISILEVDAQFELGRVEFPRQQYPVKTPEGETVGFVNDVTDAVQMLLDYFKEHPPQWEERGPRGYAKYSPFGMLEVQQDQLGSWFVYRDERDLLIRPDGAPAVFRTAEEARSVADAHLRHKLGTESKEGFEWLLWTEL